MDDLCKTIRSELEEVSQTGSIDFDQFVYIMRAPADGKPDLAFRSKANCYRLSWMLLGADCYNVRRLEPRVFRKKNSPRSPRSVYRNRTRLTPLRTSVSSKG